jgi:hypothetical protein
MPSARRSTPYRIIFWAAGLAAARLIIHLALRSAYGGFTFLRSPTEIERIRVALAFAAHPSFAPLGILTWLPLQFWADGFLLRFWNDALAVPFAVNTAASIMTVAGVVLWTAELAGEGAALAAGAAALVSGTGIVLGIGGSSDPLLHASLVWALFFWARFEKSGGVSQAWLCALSLALGSAARYEAWLVAAALTAAAVLDRRRAALAPLAAAWLFPAVWAAYNGAVAGEPWAFLALTVGAEIRDLSQPRWWLSMSFLSAAFDVVPPWLLALALGASSSRGRGLPRSYWLSIGAVALFFVGAHPFGMFEVDEHMWTIYLLALPAAGAAVASWLSGLASPRRGAAAALALLIAAESVQFFHYHRAYTTHFGPVGSVYMRLRSLRREEALDESDAILVELPEGRRQNLNQYRLWRLEPGMRGVYDRNLALFQGDELDPSGNDSALGLPRPKLAAWLKVRRVRVVVAYQHDAALAALGWTRAGGPEKAGVWVAPGDSLAKRWAP